MELLILILNGLFAVIAALIGSSKNIPGFPTLPEHIPVSVYKRTTLVMMLCGIIAWLKMINFKDLTHTSIGYWPFFELVAVSAIGGLFLGVLGSTKGLTKIGFIGWGTAVTYSLALINTYLLGYLAQSRGTLILYTHTGFTVFFFFIVVVTSILMFWAIKISFPEEKKP